MDSGTGSGGGAGAGAGERTAAGVVADEVAAEVDRFEAPDGGGTTLCWRAGTAWGSSTTDEAMSSSLAVAASSLRNQLGRASAYDVASRATGAGMIAVADFAVAPLKETERVDAPLDEGCKVVHIICSHGRFKALC